MRFDINKFADNIAPYRTSKKTENKNGLSNVINYYINRDALSDIDFNSFSLDDVLLAIEEMQDIALAEIDDEMFIADPQNPFIIFLTMDEALYNLSISKEKNYEIEDEEIFI